MTLIVSFNRDTIVASLEVITLLHTQYSPLFHEVIFTGQDAPSNLPMHIKWSDCEFDWVANYLCFGETMLEALAQKKPSRGYLFIGDDTIFDPCMFSDYNLSRPWAAPIAMANTSAEQRVASGWHWNSHYGNNPDLAHSLDEALLSLPTKYKTLASNHLSAMIQGDAVKSFAAPNMQDYVFLPAQYALDWYHLGHHFWYHGVMTEVAVPSMLLILAGLSEIEFPPGFNYVAMGENYHNGKYKGFEVQHARWWLKKGLGLHIPKALDMHFQELAQGPIPHDDRMMFWHSLKLSNTDARTLFREWFESLTCVIASSQTESNGHLFGH